MVAGCAGPTVVDDRFPVAEVDVGSTSLTVWVADTTESRTQGLMGVESLPDGVDGMLFTWEEAGNRSFHMVDTSIPLDVWWFDEFGILVGSTAMTPCPESPCPSYPSPPRVRWALETPAGQYRFLPGSVLSADR